MPTDSQTRNFHIEFDPVHNIVIMQWKGYSTSGEFRDGTNRMLDMLRHYKASRVLVDAGEMVLISQDDQKWMESVFLPGAISEGFKACALVQPKSYFNKVAIENITYKIDRRKLEVQMFSNVEAARNWIIQVDLPASEEKTPLPFSVHFEPGTGIVVMEWKGYFSSEEFRTASEQMLECLVTHQATRVLGRITDLTLIHSTDQAWLTDQFIPRAAEAGMRFCALLKPTNYFNQVAIDNVSYRISGHTVNVRSFTDEHTARAWLMTP
jgi:hypothetical protein